MLENDYFVFTGTLTTMTRKQTQAIIAGLKGHNQSNVAKKTTRLVTGYFPTDLIKGYSNCSYKLYRKLGDFLYFAIFIVSGLITLLPFHFIFYRLGKRFSMEKRLVFTFLLSSLSMYLFTLSITFLPAWIDSQKFGDLAGMVELPLLILLLICSKNYYVSILIYGVLMLVLYFRKRKKNEE